MSQLYVLFEHAVGYALFRVKEFEEVGMALPQVEKSVLDFNKFKSLVHLIAFFPFRTAVNALENMNCVTEGVVHDDLQTFLETNVPKSTKKNKVILGVSDSKLAMTVQESMGISCQHTGIVPEVIRGVRMHFYKLVKGLTDVSSSKAQLGLGHSYSRSKVKFNVNRIDNMIIQSIALLDQLDKDINTFAMRVREWYSYHFPELVKIVPDNYTYAKTASMIKNRKDLTEDSLEALEEVVMDSAKAQAIIDAARASMGMDISPVDLINIEMFASRVISLVEYRKELMEYLKTKMHDIAPNLATLIGETVGARLISHAGSLTNLAKYPASTVQILGAEKALFRALKTRGNTPKYGLIFHSTYIGRAGAKNKGRISRYLANKCSLASRIDCFSDLPTNIFGLKLKEQVEDRLKFYETGDIPRKNVDVMTDALAEAQAAAAAMKKQKRKEKKKKKKEREAMDNSTMDTTVDAEEQEEEESPPKKKKKKKHAAVEDADEAAELNCNGDAGDDVVKKPKKKKKKSQESE
ncbi:nucleolar protein 56-like [Dermacentor silvarum]|uniref:nucleolar protein 56-like n=1 Tax=Dermacentor silvarum TaxID=543639 RepID=UPI001898FA75|nr:nucleolar protein 56-like [Dermacentor silvarum]